MSESERPGAAPAGEKAVSPSTGLTPRFSSSAAIDAGGGPPPTLVLPAAMKRVHSRGALEDSTKAPKVEAADDAPTAKKRADSITTQEFPPSEAATKTGFTPDKKDEDSDASSDDEAALKAWFERQKRPSAASSQRSRRSSAKSSKRASAAASPPKPPPEPPAPRSPVLAGFDRPERESASDRRKRASDRPNPPSPPPDMPPPAAAAGDDGDDDGGFDDFRAATKEHRKRDKHSHNHGATVSRNMAIAKRAGQRAAAKGD